MSTALSIVPIGLRVAGRSILVVGAGRIAARKATVYAEQGAVVTVVAPEHSSDMDEVDVAHRVRRAFQPGDLDGMWLAVTATGDPLVDGEVFREAEQRRIWCNAADDPAHCSVTLPAVARAGDITVAISTGGRSPAVASWIRRRVEELLDDDTIAIASVTANVRAEVRAAGVGTEVDAWRDVLDGEALELAAAGRTDELHHRLLHAVIGGRS